MPEDKVKTLDKFGLQFQRKSIATLLNDKTFLHQMRDMLRPEFYDRRSLRWICDALIEYWDEYKKPPTLDFFKTRIKKQAEMEASLEADVIQQLKYIYRAREDDDLDWVKDDFHEFAHNQRLRSAILKSTELLDRGQYDSIKQEIDEAMNAGLSKDLGHIYTEDVDKRLEEDPRDTVSTGWDVLDDLTNGGLAGGELGTVCAPSGAGKCVSGDTTVEIEYEQVGFEVGDKTLWFDPWQKLQLDNGDPVSAYKLAVYLDDNNVSLQD